MKNRALTEEEFAALVRSVAETIMQSAFLQDTVGKTPPTISFAPRRGRPKSNYTGQLHARVLPEDAEWFRKTAETLGIQQGHLFTLLRRHFGEAS